MSPRNGIRAAVSVATVLLLAASCAFPGGTPLSAVSTQPTAENAKSAPFGLREALDASLAGLLEPETVDSLRRIAAEHVHNNILLRLPGIQAEYRSASPPPVETGLALLDGAIAYNHVLSAPPGSDLADEHRPRVREKIELAGAGCWARLAAVREKIELSGGIGTPELRQQEAELLLELRIATGFDDERLLTFDFSTLPMPRKLDTPLAELQKEAVLTRSETAPLSISDAFPKQIRDLYGDDPAAVPLLAEALYRLPRKLAEVQLAAPTRDLRELAALGSAAGIVCEVELCCNQLRKAWEQYEAARLRNDDTPESRAALAEALLQWRLAHFRLRAAMGTGNAAGGDLPPRPGDEKVRRELWTLLKKN